MHEAHLSNPAGRLWLIFDRARVTAANEPFHRTLCTYFGIPEGYTEAYLRAVATVWELTDQLRVEVGRLEDPIIPAETLLRPLQNIAVVLSNDPLLGNSNAWVLSNVDGAAMTQLEHASHVLGRLRPQALIPDDTIARIRDLADEITGLTIADDKLDGSARALIIRYAQRIAEAAAIYKVRGSQPLLDELDRFYSASRREKTAPEPTLRDRLIELTGVIVMAVDLFTGPANVAHAVEDYYGDLFALEQIVEAPGAPDDEMIVVAEVEADEPDSEAA